MLIWLLIQTDYEWVRKYDGNPFAETQINNHWNLVTEMPSQGNFTFQCFEQNSERNHLNANTCNKWYRRGKNAQNRSNIRWHYDIQIIMIGWFVVFYQVGVGMILLLSHICYWITTIIILCLLVPTFRKALCSASETEIVHIYLWFRIVWLYLCLRVLIQWVKINLYPANTTPWQHNFRLIPIFLVSLET